MSSIDSSLALEQLADTIRTCTLCRLCENRTHAVPGEGSYQAEIALIGEGPGKTEDETGRPFCGASGKYLTQLLTSIGLTREEVFITSVVKCRPPKNRDPLPDEKEMCAPTYLTKQLEIIRPKLIVPLGRHALSFFIPDLRISEVHGKTKRYKGHIYFPVYHPAATLYNPGLRADLEADFQLIPKLLTTLRNEVSI